MRNPCRHLFLGIWLTTLFLCPVISTRADEAELKKEIEALRQQNSQLQQQLQQQKDALDQLSQKVSGIQITNEQRSALTVATTEPSSPPVAEPEKKIFSIGNAVLGAEGGIGYFGSQKNGLYANSPFRIDELKLFLDAPVYGDIYFFGELDLLTRESYDEDFHLGQIYLDFEDLAKRWKNERLINVRLGRFYIPFGEEYQSRYAIDDPLISHSIMDIWGVDEGLELYGDFNKFSYAVAVQNGGLPIIKEGNADKSVTARLSYDPSRHWHFSASVMRTGELSVQTDGFSALWIGNGFFHSISPNPATSRFHANLAELDARYKWKTGHVAIAGGYADYDDNDPSANNRRDIYYYSVEAVQNLTQKLYAAARFSEMRVPGGGYSIPGNTSSYFPLVNEMWRLGLGIGYRWNKHFLLKGEYMFENGQTVGGGNRSREDMFSAEAAFRF